jgi:hypothetical protein
MVIKFFLRRVISLPTLPRVMKTKRTWTAPTLKDIPIFFEVSLYSGTR